MNLHKCGTKVIINDNKKSGTISAIEIRFNNVAYEITYSLNEEIKTVWLNQGLFTPTTLDNKSKIGFK